MTPVALRIVNEVSYVMRIKHVSLRVRRNTWCSSSVTFPGRRSTW